jgi:hypothetical protein
MTEIILASVGLAEPSLPPPTTTTQLMLTAAFPININIMMHHVRLNARPKPSSRRKGRRPTPRGEKDTSFPITGVTIVVLLQDGVSELMVEAGALHCSSSPNTTSLDT